MIRNLKCEFWQYIIWNQIFTSLWHYCKEQFYVFLWTQISGRYYLMFCNLIGSPYTGISWIARSISRPFLCADVSAYTSPHTLCILCIQQCRGRTRLNETSRRVWDRATRNGTITVRWSAPFVTIKCRRLGPLHLVW